MSLEKVFCISGSGDIPIAVSAAGEGEPLLFIHGTSADRGRWQPVIDLLTPSFHTLKYDRRGRGGSGDADNYSLEVETGDLLLLLKPIGKGQPVRLVAHSFGALIALATAIENPQLVSSMVLYEAPIAIPGQCQFIEPERVNELEVVLATKGKSAAASFFLKHFPRASDAEIEAMKQQASWNYRCASAATLVRELRAAHDFVPEKSKLEKLDIPVLLLLGGDSMQAFQLSAETLHKRLPNSRLEIIPGEKHRAMDTSPELLSKLINQFLAES